MKSSLLFVSIVFVTGLAVSAVSIAQTPAGSTGECKDGTYSSAESKRRACNGHGGVKEWYADKKATESKASATAAAPAKAAAAGPAPAGSTGECKDGTYSTAASKRGACGGHGGVKEWYAEKKTTESKTPAAAAVPARATPAAAAPAPAAAPSKSAAKSTQMPTRAAAGGGPGKVWVNTSSNVYHCPADKWYGKTKQGEYMSEADAKAKGAHADHGKACS